MNTIRRVERAIEHASRSEACQAKPAEAGAAYDGCAYDGGVGCAGVVWAVGGGEYVAGPGVYVGCDGCCRRLTGGGGW
jgi:hypothetical protein